MTPPFRSEPGDDRLGSLIEAEEGWELRYLRELDRPPATVWKALVDPALLALWFPTGVVGDIKEGAVLRYPDEVLPEPMTGRVLELDEPHRLTLEWGDDVLRFDLESHRGGSTLTLTVRIAELGRAARDGAGWHECLDNLAGIWAHPPGSPHVATWAEIHPSYVERFGAEASAIGPPQAYIDAQTAKGPPESS